eukprot:m.91289 g.91289  ORF g.91289 m.91289 type:complete len:315 (-) comp51136_c0_seq1:214-1158(-)
MSRDSDDDQPLYDVKVPAKSQAVDEAAERFDRVMTQAAKERDADFASEFDRAYEESLREAEGAKRRSSQGPPPVAPATKTLSRQTSSSSKMPADDRSQWVHRTYHTQAKTREEVEAMLKEDGFEEGCFLVRKRDLSSQSVKLKPGESLPFRSWALAYVKEGKFVHNIIEQKTRDGPLFLGSIDSPYVSMDELIGKLTRLPDYKLRRSPFHVQLWFHGSLERVACEALLTKPPLDGNFLVRHSSEPNSFVVSLVYDGKVYHNKIQRKGDAFFATCNPSALHRSLGSLISFHMDGANGFQTILVRPIFKDENSLPF